MTEGIASCRMDRKLANMMTTLTAALKYANITHHIEWLATYHVIELYLWTH